MKKLYTNTATLDKRLVSEFGLDEEILMENAANAMLDVIKRIVKKQSHIIIVCGGGDNGGDGYALARKLCLDYEVGVFIAKNPSSKLCVLQHKRALACGVKIINRLESCDVMVDCLFGSGFKGAMSKDYVGLINKMNSVGNIRIACDIPSGLDIDGNIVGAIFNAHYTICMGALKLALYSDNAKDIVGEIIVGDLGVSRDIYEIESNMFVLDSSDLVLPLRKANNCHKGNFGHLAVIIGEKRGAGILSALSAMRIGAGLVSAIVLDDERDFAFMYPEIMFVKNVPKNANVIVAGMGLGGRVKHIDLIDFFEGRGGVIDADLFYEKSLLGLLKKANKNYPLILTPHPKEFASLLSIVNLGDFSVEEVINNRFKLARMFSQKFNNVVLLLKGANPIIAFNGSMYINPLGTNALAKGGSGDVLSGIIGGLLAQGFKPLESALYGSIIHSLGAKMEKNNYAMTPLKLIEYIGRL